tara:strand:+ start:434 stop:985 length:552 start_codon:yes stop_codon:yes gene_type:complete
MPKNYNICVFCGSQSGKNKIFLNTSYELGVKLSQKGYTIIYGGGKNGLMGEIARGVLENNGKLISIVPEYFNKKEITEKKSSEIINTKSFNQRKEIMIKKANIFLCLPGGLGTLDELLEVATLNQLKIINKKIIVIDTKNFWDPLKKLFENLNKKGFLYDFKRSNIIFIKSIKKAVEFIEENI